METYAIAWKLHTFGYAVLPSGGGSNGKSPLLDHWKEFQQRQPTDSEMQTWAEQYHPTLWGIVTGSVVVFDCDSEDARRLFEVANLHRHVRTPRGGCHYYFKAPSHPVKTVAGLLPGLDVRATGGFCNVVGGNGSGSYHIEILPEPEALYSWGQLPREVLAALNAQKMPKPAGARGTGEPIPEGERNHRLTSLAGTMRRKGMSQEAIEAALLATNASQCSPPLPEDEVRAIAASVARYEPAAGSSNVCVCNDRTGQTSSSNKRDKNGTENGTIPRQNDPGELSRFEALSCQVLAWVEDTTGWFETRELDADLGIGSTRDKENRKKILQRLREQGRVEAHPRINKQFRFVNQKVTAIDFKSAATAGVLPIKWPMGIEKYVNLFPGNLAVVAGAPNAGKTALLLNVIRLNMAQMPTYYFCSEMGSVELRNRLEEFPGMAIEDWTFKALERSSDYEDVIVPDALNIVDYLEMTDELYRVNSHLTAMSHKIGSGLAIVALQKKTGATYGRGQEFGLEKPKLYVSMDKGKLTIVKGKSWAQKNVNPAGLRVGFKITGGCEFEITERWDWLV